MQNVRIALVAAALVGSSVMAGCGEEAAQVHNAIAADSGGNATGSEVVGFADDMGEPSTDTGEMTDGTDGVDGGVPDAGPDIGGEDAGGDVGSPASVLCLPCSSPVDCAKDDDYSAHCIVRESGDAYCGVACSASNPCPDGYECLLTESMSASAVSQCLPVAETWCPGDEPKCEPFELCNGEDDDCDGETDEDTCDDGEACTIDQCLGPDGCSNLPSTGDPCDDGNACTSADSCQDGLCVGDLGDGCQAGESGMQACGNCGTQSCQCSDSCTWENCSTCMGEGPCAAGETDTQSESCGACGTKTRSRTCGDDCQWGGWTDWTDCGGGGGCTPGQSDSQTQACGKCGEQTRTRVCSAECGWGGWSDWSSCSGQGVCTAGQKQTDSTGCGNCGTKSRTRTCSNSCTWGNWSDYGSCGGQGVCSPGSKNASGCDPCAEKTCNNSCQWGGCGLKSGAQCLYEGGSNWKCCGGGKWHFCLGPSYGCIWSDQCAACSGCGC